MLTTGYNYHKVTEAKANIRSLIKICKECGLEINKEKSKFMIFNQKNQPSHIEEIEVVKSLKYLGVTITNKRDCFKEHRENTIDKAQRLANLTYSVMARSCNKMLIGKTFWKSLALTGILYGASILVFKKEEKEKLQTIENTVYRKNFGGTN